MCCDCIGGGDYDALKLIKDEVEDYLLPLWLTSLNGTNNKYVWDRLVEL